MLEIFYYILFLFYFQRELLKVFFQNNFEKNNITRAQSNQPPSCSNFWVMPFDLTYLNSCKNESFFYCAYISRCKSVKCYDFSVSLVLMIPTQKHAKLKSNLGQFFLPCVFLLFIRVNIFIQSQAFLRKISVISVTLTPFCTHKVHRVTH